MLQLQRASAGSGKTYTLAKRYIEFYLSEPTGNGKRRLRPIGELREALQRILAITFTNKATNEMKLRIVEKLNALAGWKAGMRTDKTDYLEDFMNEFSCSAQEIASYCKYALKVLLTDYGDFKVSTIDSFFQTVLRTFAYEADLDDTYQIELDSNYVTQMGLDTILDKIETEDANGQAHGWIGSMMESKALYGKGWNIFQRNTSQYNVYGEILNASRNLAKEDFKKIRTSLEEYFEKYPDFIATFNELTRIYEKDLRAAHDKMRRAARELEKAFSEAGLDISEHGGQYLGTRANKMARLWDWDKTLPDKDRFTPPVFTRKGTRTRVFDPNPKKENPYLGTPTEDRIEELAAKMYEYYEEWQNEANSDKMRRWKIYRTTLPYVGLLHNVMKNARLFLTESNTVELGETNSILSRIIGDSDAPFVYERLGSRLAHFLIDEFQDTSKLQWHILRPLIIESESNLNENLIIGDAKQSIYRFRNADPKLITTEVPREFAESCLECGSTPKENTNWRSSQKIVKFNNLFFKYFAKALDKDLDLHGMMERLYFNTIQPASHKADRGYVKVQLFKNEKGEDDIPAHFQDIPDLIADMLRRGYRMNEIAVLVDTHKQGTQVISTIMEYNRKAEERINFISADSLETGESPAVQTVISILEAINNGTHAELRPEEERRDKGAGEWSKLRADFSFFAAQNPGTPLSELLSRFIAGEFNPDSIREIMASMQTTVLPALIENIILSFLPEKTRQSEAPFLASLQDLTIEYCERTTADIASFLDWWDKKGKYKSISSPEGSNAINIMTVHKSKGLEFRCVIVPYSKQTTEPASQQREWLWVKPDLSEAEGVPQIDYIPVWSEPRLADTIHAPQYQEYLENYLVDKVNMAYVAYTRAIDELYIYSPCELKNGTTSDTKKIGAYLWRCGKDAEETIREIRSENPDIADYLPDAADIEIDVDSWSYGHKPTREKIDRLRKEKEKEEAEKGTKKAVKSIIITDYRSNEPTVKIHVKEQIDLDRDLLPEDLREEKAEETASAYEREYGKKMHAIMQTLTTAADLHPSLLRMKGAGLISTDEMEHLERELGMALEKEKARGWFDAGVRVLTERSIVGMGEKAQRPDRIILRPDGSAVIVDYKFGSQRNDKVYLRQVKRYADALLKTGVAQSCEAYVWYVSLGEVVKLMRL